MIRKCELTLKSIVDGAENLFTIVGRLEDHAGKIKVCYCEQPAVIHVVFGEKGQAWVDREGDYSLRLFLKEGEVTQGEIGINGNVGNLEIRTHRIEYDYSGIELTACLRYDLLLGENDVQEMQLQICARVI